MKHTALQIGSSTCNLPYHSCPNHLFADTNSQLSIRNTYIYIYIHTHTHIMFYIIYIYSIYTLYYIYIYISLSLKESQSVFANFNLMEYGT